MSVESAERLKQENEQKIIEAFRALLAEKIIKTASLTEIAHRAGVSKKTVSNIFETKQNLVLLVAIRQLEDYFVSLSALTETAAFDELSGIEQVMAIQTARAKYYEQNPWLVRLIFDVESGAVCTKAEMENCLRYLRLIASLKMFYDEPLERGRQDGSIRDDLSKADAESMLFFVFGAVTQRLSSMDSNAVIRQEINMVEIMRSVLRLTRAFLCANDKASKVVVEQGAAK